MSTGPTAKPGPNSARLARWRAFTLSGNLAFEGGHDVRARESYEAALSEAEEMFEAAVLTNDSDAACIAPVLHGISCNNVIELARRQDDELTVGIYLYRIAARLIGIAEAVEAALDLRLRCLLHLEVASHALYRHFEKHGMWQAAQSYEGRANAATFSVRELAAASGGAKRLRRTAGA
jgi:hypothetical protein